MSGNRKAIPKKLDEELQNLKYYKPKPPSANEQPTGKKLIAKVQDDSAERAMYDEILGPLLGRKHNSKPILPNLPSKGEGPSSSSNTDFNTSIISRLAAAESEVKEYRRKLAEQLEANTKLENEVGELRQLADDPTETLDELKAVRTQNKRLQNQIHEMEIFLSDYGLVWVGNDTFDEGEEEEEDEDSMEHLIDFPDFAKQINELNNIVYSEPSQVLTDQNSRKARLVQASELVEHIRIVFYKNGVMIKRGPFRYCGSESYKTFVSDIMDGYFPTEFRDDYPDGVIFDLKDKKNEDYVENNSDDVEQQMSKEQLLNRLPKKVIRGGEVVDMRSDVGERLNAEGSLSSSASYSSATPANKHAPPPGMKKNSMIVISTPAYSEIAATEGEGGATEKEKGVQIQIRWIESGTTLMATMYAQDTIGDLKQQIERHFGGVSLSDGVGGSPRCSPRGKSRLRPFEMRSAYPPRLLQETLTLQEAGLVPNGTVHAKAV